MREIEYRGKRKDNGEWAYGNLIIKTAESPIPETIDRYEFCGIDEQESYPNSSILEVIPETVGQYTGLKDKTGNKIYEGDILQFNDKNGIWNTAVIFTRGLFGLDICGVKQIENPPDWDKPYDKVESRWWGVQWGYEEYGTAFEYRRPLAQATLYSEGRPDDTERYNNSEYHKWHEKHGWGEYRVDAEVVGNRYDQPEILDTREKG